MPDPIVLPMTTESPKTSPSTERRLRDGRGKDVVQNLICILEGRLRNVVHFQRLDVGHVIDKHDAVRRRDEFRRVHVGRRFHFPHPVKDERDVVEALTPNSDELIDERDNRLN
jgi:hypothetical protein